MTSDASLAELRGLPGAPETLRGRVLALPEPQPRFSWTLPRLEVRRFLLVAAPTIIALGLGAAALHGLRASGTGGSFGAIDTVQHGERALPPTGSLIAPSYGAAQGDAVRAPRPKATSLPPATTRLNKYEAWLRVRVADDRLSTATTRAMQIARGYGGYVASVDMNTPGQR